jgi:hypothetical protein
MSRALVTLYNYAMPVSSLLLITVEEEEEER